jgi:hypothetical protein
VVEKKWREEENTAVMLMALVNQLRMTVEERD